ncbi:SRPBCC family protein [Dactylosporangium sp. NPDC000244]|uniref:SRPBCC family protein n=1 Tax=Dactylosporangium sp. NPDC000244 TaxID=3154365 RepID=UPI00332A2937
MSGQLIPGDGGHDLVLVRTFRAGIEDVWASVTEPERSARWFGPWEGQGGTGGTIKVRMVQEEGEPVMDLRIDACEPPRRLAVSGSEEAGGWRMEVLLTERDGTTELRLVHRGVDVSQVGEVGPGWEFYLDALVAAREGTPAKPFEDYYPSMKPYYESLSAD